MAAYIFLAEKNHNDIKYISWQGTKLMAEYAFPSRKQLHWQDIIILKEKLMSEQIQLSGPGGHLFLEDI